MEFSLEPLPSVEFTALDGSFLTAKYGEAPSIDGSEVDYSKWRLFDGPFAQAERESQTLEISYNKQRYLLDFKTNRAEVFNLPDQ